MCKSHFYYGDGKGKTTSAIGAAVRMLGYGGRVLFVSFLKKKDQKELDILKKCGGEIMVPYGCSVFFGQLSHGEQEKCIEKQNSSLQSIMGMSNQYDLVILDEAATAVEMNCLSSDLLLSLIKKQICEIIVTGHAGLPELVNCCDYVTEMKKVKHPFDEGLPARKGIEF